MPRDKLNSPPYFPPPVHCPVCAGTHFRILPHVAGAVDVICTECGRGIKNTINSSEVNEGW